MSFPYRITASKKREGDFPFHIKKAAFERQGGVCAFCGVPLYVASLSTVSAKNAYAGEAHHLRPLLHGGTPTFDNCVYLCYAHHKLLGHGMAAFGIDKQGGDSRTWVDFTSAIFLTGRNLQSPGGEVLRTPGMDLPLGFLGSWQKGGGPWFKIVCLKRCNSASPSRTK